jgi:hypothetical protein
MLIHFSSLSRLIMSHVLHLLCTVCPMHYISHVLYVPCTVRPMHYIPYVHLHVILADASSLNPRSSAKVMYFFFIFFFFPVNSNTLGPNTAPYSQTPSTYTRILPLNFIIQVTVLNTVFNFPPFHCIRFPHRKLRLRILHCFKNWIYLFVY